ncbi:MAG TPA: carbon-nitrogen hydrolase family protein, partial [Nocardioidaceae bacterium]|nr:carbon-nitrogen hydrolase family protein [Nocardioidaceae bacterium]
MQATVVQMSATTDKAGNAAAIERLMAQAGPGSDLVVLPEAVMHDFGKPDDALAPAAEPLDGPFVGLLQRLAGEHHVTVVAGMFEQTDEPGRVFNTLVAVSGAGLLARYRKTHLYDSFGYRESDTVGAGAIEPVVVDVRGVPVGLMTCYDLRFPELGRALVDAGARIFAVPAAWVAGERKAMHWTTLLRARAIENLVYVVGAAQCGPRYTGHSLVVSPYGDTIVEADNDETVLNV